MNRCLSVIILIVIWSSAAVAGENVTGRIAGSWVPPDFGPISNGLIYAFDATSGVPPHRDRPLHSPVGIAVTDAAGKFSLELPEGTYYLSTRKQTHGDMPGPPQEGDLYGLVRDQKGEFMKFTVKRGETTDVGVLRRATVYKARGIKLSEGTTAIVGVVKTVDGTPLADAVVLVYDNSDVKRKPDFVSRVTGKDGKYVVRVDRGGTFFLTARTVDEKGGRPKAGGLVGVYGGETMRPVTVEEHKLVEGIDIEVHPFVDKRPANRPPLISR